MAKCKLIKAINKEKKKYKVKLPWWQKLFGYCPCCNRYFKWPVTTERRHTEYCEPSNNYLTACKECHYEDDSYFDERWEEYNASRL